MARKIRTPEIAKDFVECYRKLTGCSGMQAKKLQDWARTRTETNCGWIDYRVAKIILENMEYMRH